MPFELNGVLQRRKNEREDTGTAGTGMGNGEQRSNLYAWSFPREGRSLGLAGVSTRSAGAPHPWSTYLRRWCGAETAGGEGGELSARGPLTCDVGVMQKLLVEKEVSCLPVVHLLATLV